MLSLTIFAAAASAATQTAPVTIVAPPNPPLARRPEHAADRPGLDRSATVWRFTDAGVDGGQIWL
jgi:hypothetical protein